VDIKVSLSPVMAGLKEIGRNWKNPVIIPTSKTTMSTSPLN
jgi:hypothetical protein